MYCCFNLFWPCCGRCPGASAAAAAASVAAAAAVTVGAAVAPYSSSAAAAASVSDLFVAIRRLMMELRKRVAEMPPEYERKRKTASPSIASEQFAASY